jgi:integrase
MMNSAASKLGKLENVQIMEHIQNYFNELNRKNRDYVEKTKNATQIAYETDIRLFFHLIRSKSKGAELEYLSLDDISITQDDFEEYIDALYNLKDVKGENKYVIKTINKKVAALKSFIRYMKKKKVIDTDISYLELIKGEKERDVHYGVFTYDEVMKLSELALEERNKGLQKKMLILFDFKTGLRISEILNLKWSDFYLKNDNDVVVKGIGKGNKEFEIKITRELYDDLQVLNLGQQNVFDISARRVGDMIERLTDKMELPKSRKLVFHSIRKAFGTLVWESSGDIEIARRALRHSDCKTTQIYLGTGAYEMNDAICSIEKIEENLFMNVSHEELVEAISSCSNNIKLILNMKLQELLNKNN